MNAVTAFAHNLKTSRRGEQFSYHYGLLIADRDTDSDARAVGNAAWQAYEAGRVCLVQRRHGDYDYEYLAVKR